MLGCMVMLLVVEYRFFHDQAHKMLELKEEYRSCTVAMRRLINESQAPKETAAECGGSIPLQTQDLESNQSRDSFMTVNRDLGYLKQSMIDYLKEQHVEHLLEHIDLNEWADYTDQALCAPQSPAPRKKVRSRPRARLQARKVRSCLGVSHVRITPAQIQKDFIFTWPIEQSQFWLSSPFGPRKNPSGWSLHTGIDMAAVKGTPVKAAAAGAVIEAGPYNGYGNTVVIEHSKKYKTRYAHLDKILVSRGQQVPAGKVIGKVGATGLVRGKDPSHLHFEVCAFGKRVNPLYYLI